MTLIFYQEIGKRIRAEREALGFTQAEVAQLVGLSRPAINNIEAGRQQLLVHTLSRIAWTLGINVSCLLPGENTGEQAWQEGEQDLDALASRHEFL